MDFSYAQVVEALASMHFVAPSRMGAFKARLRNFQSKGFPAGINTGRGKAASYQIEHVLKLTIALELNELGLSPDRAIVPLTKGLRTVAVAIKAALGSSSEGVVLYCDPSALQDLRDGSDASASSFYHADKSSIHSMIDHWSSSCLKRLSFINLTAVLESLSAFLANLSAYSEVNIRGSMLIWAIEFDRAWQNGELADDDDPQA